MKFVSSDKLTVKETGKMAGARSATPSSISSVVYLTRSAARPSACLNANAEAVLGASKARCLYDPPSQLLLLPVGRFLY